MDTNGAMTTPPEADTPQGNPKSRFCQYAAIDFAFFITLALVSYTSVFLQSIGFGAQQVGLMSALNSGVGVVSAPFWGTLSDKMRSLKKIIVPTLVAGAVLFALTPALSGLHIGGLSFLFVIIPVAMFFISPQMWLIDNWILFNSARQRLNYGALRAFGALSYAIASLTLGLILPTTGVTLTFYAYAILILPTILLIMFARDSADDRAGGKKHLTFKEMQFGQLFKNYHLIAYIIFTIFQRIPFQCSLAFLPFLVADSGGDIAQMGIIMGIRAFVEIPMMLLLKPLRKKIPLYHIIMASTGFFVLECILYSFANSFGMIIAISILHGLGNGLMVPAGSSYVFSLAPENLKATAQTAMGSIGSIAGILGGVLGGFFIALLGIKHFYLIIGAMLFVALVLFMLSFVVGERFLGKKRPGLSVG